MNLFHATGLFLYLTKSKGKPQVLRCFQEVKKEASGMKCIKNKMKDYKGHA